MNVEKIEENIELKYVDINKFKDNLYSHYIKIFPLEEERKTLEEIIFAYKKNYLKIIEILDNDIIIGFMMINNVCKKGYVILDYLAILPQYRSRGYGTKAVKKLINLYKDNKGIFIEVEDTQDLGINIRRKKFYENLDFKRLNFDLLLFDLKYNTYLYSNMKINENLIIEEIIDIYKKIYGESIIQENCKIINNLKFVNLSANNLNIATTIQYKIFPNACAYSVYKSKVMGQKDTYFENFITYLFDKPIGVIGLYEIPKYSDTIWISWFGLLEEYRGMGLAKQMLNFIIGVAKSKKKKFLRLYTFEVWNNEAQKFYKKNMEISEYYFNEKEKYKFLFDGKPQIFGISLCDEKIGLWNNKFINISEDEDVHKESIQMLKKSGII